jgi:hypothetical protein
MKGVVDRGGRPSFSGDERIDELTIENSSPEVESSLAAGGRADGCCVRLDILQRHRDVVRNEQGRTSYAST